MNVKRLTISLALPFSLLFAACGNKVNPALIEIKTKVKSVTDVAFGNIDFELNQKDFENAGFNYDDLMEFTIHDYNDQGDDLTFEGAFVKNYNEAGYFAPCLCNYGGTEESPSISFGIMPQKDHAESLLNKDVTIKMIEKQGYHRTRELVDVATKLTYEEVGKDNLAYANFRDVTSVGNIARYIQANRLFRGSSPFNASANPGERDVTADAYLEVYGIESEVSLANSDEEVEELMEKVRKRRPSYAYNLYSASKEYTEKTDYPKKSFFSVGLGGDYFSMSEEGNGKDAQKVFEYFADRCVYLEGGPKHSFYIHCNEGKDRTGFFAMVLEALAGCQLDDLVADAMLTFKNYYNVSIVNNKEKYDALANLLIYRQIYSILLDNPVEELPKINWYTFDAEKAVKEKVGSHAVVLSYAANNYLRSIDVSQDKIEEIKDWLTAPIN